MSSKFVANDTAKDQAELPPKPKPPMPGECCGCRCVPCIWDYYHKALAKWQVKVKATSLPKAEKLT